MKSAEKSFDKRSPDKKRQKLELTPLSRIASQSINDDSHSPKAEDVLEASQSMIQLSNDRLRCFKNI